jgi:hypothetical protein
MSTSAEEGGSVGDNERYDIQTVYDPDCADDQRRLISALKSCFYDLMKKQEEQAYKYVIYSLCSWKNLTIPRIHQAVEALKPHESFDRKTAFWDSYMKLADEHDKEFQKKYSNDLDTSLIFVCWLFSLVQVSF